MLTQSPAPQLLDLEVKDVRVIFKPIWEDLEEEVGQENLRFPKEIILLVVRRERARERTPDSSWLLAD